MSESKYRPRMRFYHPNPKGTGCALSLVLLPADAMGEGCIMATIAKQATIGNLQGSTPVYPTFNWEGGITIKLDFSDLCKILQVLRGECENVEDGKGLFHRSATASTKIFFRHLVEPVSGYALEVQRPSNGAEGEGRMLIVLSPSEALGLAESIAGSMSVICFGVPRESAEMSKKKSGRNDEAA
jgi:hypothetical protein